MKKINRLEVIEFNKEYTVSDNAPLSQLYIVKFEQSKLYDDLIIVHDGLYNETYYLTEDEIKETFTFYTL